MTTRALLGGAILALATATTIHADDRATRYEVIDFSEQYNIRADRNSIDRNGFFNARTMPNDEQETRDGVPFVFGPDRGPYAWNAMFSEGENPRVLEIDTDLQGAVRVYTMINTFWGTDESGKMAIEFLGSDGAFHREELRGGVNVRDYNQNSERTNTTSAPNVREVYENHRGQRIDMQTWTLPDDFADETLALIRVVDTGAEEVSRAMVWAMTAEVLDPGRARVEALALIESARRSRAAASNERTVNAKELVESIRERRASQTDSADH